MPPNGSDPTMTRSSASTRSHRYYYYPGWWEGGTTHPLASSISDKWNELPNNYKAIWKPPPAYANMRWQARYDARNPQALRRLVANGVQLRPFSQADHGSLPEGLE